jgi:hypothetical protein
VNDAGTTGLAHSPALILATLRSANFTATMDLFIVNFSLHSIGPLRQEGQLRRRRDAVHVCRRDVPLTSAQANRETSGSGGGFHREKRSRWGFLH